MNSATAQVIIPTRFGWEPYRSLDNDERLACCASKYFSAGHHRRPRTDYTARNPQGSDIDVSRQDGALSDPLEQRQPRGAAIADAALIPNEVTI